jgi:acetyltransferase-like isoleucine patch superfamily enzyme
MYSSRLYFVHLLFALIPLTRFYSLKRKLLRWAGAKIGSNVRVVSSARFHLTGSLVIGDNTYIGEEVLFVGGDAEIKIGSNVSIGPRVTIVTGTHELFTVNGQAAGKGFSAPIIIENGVWIGASATIIAGSKLRESCMVAAGALVNREVSAYQVVGGIPARVIKTANFVR